MSEPIVDDAFKSLSQEPCFLVWRIENFKPVPWNDIGSFCSGDSYIVLHGYKKGASAKTYHDIYFWLGKDSSQDETGTAAKKTVELDDFFGGEPIQHREVQGHESDKFITLFDQYGGIRYLEGGVASGFKAVPVDTSVTLYQVKGKRKPVLQQVAANGKSLNNGDVFILSTPQKIFMFVGKTANLMEKNKGAQMLDQFHTKNPKAAVERFEPGQASAEFWGFIGGECPISDASGADDAFEAENIRKIFKVDGVNSFAKVAEGASATPAVLETKNIYIIQRGNQALVWIGNGADASLKKQPLIIGTNYLKSQNLPSWIIIDAMKEGTSSEDYDVIFA